MSTIVYYNVSPETTANRNVNDIFSNFVALDGYEHGEKFVVQILDQEALDRIVTGQESCNDYHFEDLFVILD